jgi:hypothetical protein
MAQVQPIGELSVGMLAAFIASETRKEFPSEMFLDEELSRIVGGVFNAFNWGLIRMVDDQRTVQQTTYRLEHLETKHHLTTPWIGREEIISHAMDTTGLPLEVITFALGRLEDRIDLELRIKKSVRIGWLGTVTRSPSSPKGYRIILSEDLRFPSSL